MFGSRFSIRNLRRFVALKVRVDFSTGWRAGGVNPRDPNLVCLGWQNLEDGWEIRLIVNESKIDEYVRKYSNVDGVEIIEGVENIDKAIDEIIPKDKQIIYDIYIPELFAASVIGKHLDPKDSFNVNKVPNPDPEDASLEESRRKVLKYLMEQGVKGIRPVRRARKLSEILQK